MSLSFHQSSWSGYILDPKSMGKEYGDKAKNFQHDLADAKKLIEAAGFKTPFEYEQVISKQTPTSFAPPQPISVALHRDGSVWKVTDIAAGKQTCSATPTPSRSSHRRPASTPPRRS